MRILLMPASYPPVVGGLQTVAHNLAIQLLKRGHEVRIVTNRYPIDLPPREHVEGVLVDRVLLLKPSLDQLRRQRPDLFLAALYYGPKSYWRLTNVFNEFRPDVVNLHFPDHQIDAVLRLRNRFKFRLVVSLHGDDVERFTNGNKYLVGAGSSALRLRAMLQSADAVTAVSRDLLNKATKVEPTIDGKSYVVHNGIDPARFQNKRSYKHPRPYIFAFGRLTGKKGFDLLIEAFARHKAQTKMDLILAGEGEEEGPLRAQVEQSHLADNVKFFGKASPREVVELLNGCLGVVMPSRIEPFGIVALEALAAGKPLLGTETAGLQALLTDLLQNNGSTSSDAHRRMFLVEPTVEGIAGGLRGLLDAIESTSTPSDFRIPEKYTWPHVTQCYERILLGH